jgi:hypothetical protein
MAEKKDTTTPAGAQAGQQTIAATGQQTGAPTSPPTTTTPGGVVVPDPPKPEQKTSEPTEYVLLHRAEFEEEHEDGKGRTVVAWEEVGRVSGVSRPAAWAQVEKDHSQVLPTQIGEQEQAQLVPARFWKTITASGNKSEFTVTVDGL